MTRVLREFRVSVDLPVILDQPDPPDTAVTPEILVRLVQVDLVVQLAIRVLRDFKV